MLKTDSSAPIEAHIGYAKALAAKVRRQAQLPAHVDQQELEGWALLGLTQAAARFDASRGVAFSTFAYRRIVGAVLNGVGKMSDVSARHRHLARRLSRAQAALPGPMASDTTPAQARETIAQAATQVGAVFAMQTLAPRPVASPAAEEPGEVAAQHEALERLRGAIAALPEELGRVVALHHLEQRPMAQVAQALGLSPATVCRRNKEALALLGVALRG